MSAAERRLAAILSADAVGYSRLMAADEVATVRTIQGHREVMTEAIHSHAGRVVDATGDNLLAEFPSALQAVEAAVSVQRALAERNRELPEDHRMLFRVGIHAGDVHIEDGRLYGDAVNLAARLEPRAPAGGLCVSGDVYRQVYRRLALPFEDIGDQYLKNIREPVRAYRLELDPESAEPIGPEAPVSKGYLEDFEHDVFISYAPIDDRPDHEGERGWVESFARALQLRLLKRFGREVGIWRPDPNHSESGDPVIERAVKGSAIMLSLVSKSYLESESCHREVEWFAGKTSEEPAGLVVGDRVRVIPVLLYNVPRDEWPSAFRGTQSVRFHEAEERGFGRPLDPDRDKFDDQLCALVEEVHTLLTAIERVGSETADEPEPAAGRAIFLAEVSDDMRRMRRDLRHRLEGSGIEIVQAIPPPEDLIRHEAVVVEALRHARLSVHLLGTLPGRPLDEDEPARTYTTEQMRIGLDHSPSQLVVMPTGFEPGDIEEPDYADLITKLQNQQREADQLEIIRTGRAQLVDEVLTKLERIEAQEREALGAAAEQFAGSAFVDLHVNDLPYAGDLVGHLAQRHIAPITVPSGDLDPKTGMSIFEEHLRKTQLFIVVFGKVARGWVEQRLNEAFKLILSNRLRTRVGVYVAPPHKSADDISFPPFFRVMDNSVAFDPSTVDELLSSPEESA